MEPKNNQNVEPELSLEVLNEHLAYLEQRIAKLEVLFATHDHSEKTGEVRVRP